MVKKDSVFNIEGQKEIWMVIFEWVLILKEMFEWLKVSIEIRLRSLKLKMNATSGPLFLPYSAHIYTQAMFSC